MSKLLEIALSQYGVTEILGPESNPTIVQYSQDIGFGGVIDDQLAWCSVFINWVAVKAGLRRSGALNARSWLTVGKKITDPEPGDVVIFWRSSPDSWKGHVGIFISYSEDKKFIYCLGGNQSNQVNIKPYRANRLLGYRCLEE